MDDEFRRSHIIKWTKTIGEPWLRSEHEIEAGSSLAGDDKTDARVSEICRYGIVVAIDHMVSVVDAMLTDDPLRHYAPLTALRTVLETSARSVWILTGKDRHQRQNRAIRVRIKSLSENIKAADELAGSHLDDQVTESLKNLVGELTNARDRLITDHPEAARIGLNTVDQIAQQVERNTFEGNAVSYLWRTGSASAHGYPWTEMMRKDPTTLDLEWFHTSLYGAYLRLLDAFDTYESRRRNHHS